MRWRRLSRRRASHARALVRAVFRQLALQARQRFSQGFEARARERVVQRARRRLETPPQAALEGGAVRDAYAHARRVRAREILQVAQSAERLEQPAQLVGEVRGALAADARTEQAHEHAQPAQGDARLVHPFHIVRAREPARVVEKVRAAFCDGGLGYLAHTRARRKLQAVRLAFERPLGRASLESKRAFGRARHAPHVPLNPSRAAGRLRGAWQAPASSEQSPATLPWDRGMGRRSRSGCRRATGPRRSDARPGSKSWR